jgi:hypothetical protein
MHNDDDPKDAFGSFMVGILSAAFDWTPEQRAATDPHDEYENVIFFDDYRTLH